MALIKEAILNLRLTGFEIAEAQLGALGGAMAGVQTQVNRVGQESDRATKQAEGGVLSLQRQWRNLAAVVQATVVVLGTAGAAAAGLFRLGQQGESVNRVRDSFESMAGGVDRADQRLRSMREATAGVLTDFELMVGVNRLTVAQLGLTDQQMAQAAKSALIMARALGIDASDAFNRLTLALAKQEPELIDEIGLKVDLTAAVREEARARGVAVSTLDAQTRGQIFANAVVAQAQERAAQLGVQFDLQASATERVSVQLRTMVDLIAEYVAANPQVIEAIGLLALKALDLADALLTVVNAFSSVASFAGDFAVGAIGGAVAGSVIPGVGTGIGAVAGGTVNAVRGLVFDESGFDAQAAQFKRDLQERNREIAREGVARARVDTSDKIAIQGGR